MGSAGCSILRFSSLGHQSRFDLTPLAVCVNGHFASVDICFLLWSVDRRYHLRHPTSDQGRQYTAVAFTRTPTRGVCLNVGDAREVEIPAIGPRLARSSIPSGSF